MAPRLFSILCNVQGQGNIGRICQFYACWFSLSRHFYQVRFSLFSHGLWFLPYIWKISLKIPGKQRWGKITNIRGKSKPYYSCFMVFFIRSENSESGVKMTCYECWWVVEVTFVLKPSHVYRIGWFAPQTCATFLLCSPFTLQGSPDGPSLLLIILFSYTKRWIHTAMFNILEQWTK